MFIFGLSEIPQKIINHFQQGEAPQLEVGL